MASYRTFFELRDAVVDKYLNFYPTHASNLGLHEYDSKIEDFSVDSRRQYTDFLTESRDCLIRDHSQSSLDRIENFEKKALLWKIDEELFRLNELREFEWNPLYYGTQLELQQFFNRDYAPLEERVRAATLRLRRIPQALAIARQNIFTQVDRTIVETALASFDGYLSYYNDVLDDHLSPLEGKQVYTDFEEALLSAKLSLASFIDSIRNVLLPKSLYDSFRLGEERMQKFVAKAELAGESLEELLVRGRNEINALTSRLMEVSRSIDSQSSPHEVFQGFVEDDHFNENMLIPETAKMLERVRQFLIDHKIISIPSDVRCKVVPTPPYLRWAFAAMDSPGAFETVATEAYYYVTPPEPEWSDHKKKDFLRGLNRSVLEIISIHEAYPGHYIHFLHLKNSRSKLGKIFHSTGFIEGWAHYTEEMMLQSGWGNGDLRIEMAYLQEALIRLCRYVTAIELHRGTMTLSEAQHLFEEKALMRPVAARKEAERGVFDPGYMFYSHGKLKIRELRAQLENRKDFSQNAFHDELLSYGCAPLPLISEMMFGGR